MNTLNGKTALRTAQERLARQAKGSAELYERSRHLMPGGVTSNIRYADPHPLYVRDARGARIWDVDGHEYVDCRLGFGPVILGHSPEVITASVMRALMNGTVYAMPHLGETELAEKVIDSVPGAEMTTFCSSGSEATLHTIRLARAYTGRKKIAKFEGGYHGIHDTVMMSVQYKSGEAGPVEAPVATVESLGIPEETVANTMVLPFNHPAALGRIADHAHELAAVIVEPVQGSAGSIPGTPEFLASLRAVTARYGIVLIFDEVITGFRVALGGAQEHYGLRADLVSFGKVLGGGFPFGAVAGSRDILQLMSVPDAKKSGRMPVAYGGTFNGNPTSVAAANATLDFLREHRDLYGTMNARGDRIRQEVPTRAAALGIPLQACGLGSLFAFRFVDRPVLSVRDAAAEDPDLLQALFLFLLTEGVLTHPRHSFLSNAHGDAEIDAIVQGYDRSLREIQAAA